MELTDQECNDEDNVPEVSELSGGERSDFTHEILMLRNINAYNFFNDYYMST
jgi:hypothetical protein